MAVLPYAIKSVSPRPAASVPCYKSGTWRLTLSSDRNLLLSVLLDQYGTPHSREQEVRLRRHSSSSGGGVAAISVLSTNMAVLGEDSRVSLWLLGTVNNTALVKS